MFDPRAAKALAAGDHLTIDEAPGLRLVASANARTWTYRYKSPIDGRMRQIKLGRWPAMGLPAALVAWERAKDARDHGADPAVEKRSARREARAAALEQAYTVRRACDDYLTSYQGSVTEKTYREAERILRAELGALAELPAAEVTRAHAFDLVESVRHKPIVASRLRQLLGAVWDRALDAGRLPAETPNWWRLVMRGRLKSRGRVIAGENVGTVKRVLSEAELAQLLPWLPNFPRDVEDALTLYLWTCCRGAEIMQMERGEITEELDGLWWTVPVAKLKMRRIPALEPLRVPLVGRAEEVVRRRLAAVQASYLFPSRAGDTPYMQQKVIGVAVWARRPDCSSRPEWVRARLPVVGWAPHDLRRTGRTLLAALGCPAEVAEAILGHIQPGIQGIYNRHGYDAERRLWLTRLSGRLEQLARLNGSTADPMMQPQDTVRAL